MPQEVDLKIQQDNGVEKYQLLVGPHHTLLAQPQTTIEWALKCHYSAPFGYRMIPNMPRDWEANLACLLEFGENHKGERWEYLYAGNGGFCTLGFHPKEVNCNKLFLILGVTHIYFFIFTYIDSDTYIPLYVYIYTYTYKYTYTCRYLYVCVCSSAGRINKSHFFSVAGRRLCALETEA